MASFKSENRLWEICNNPNLQFVFKEAQEHNAILRMQKYTTVLVLYTLLLGGKNLLPTWLPIDVDPKKQIFWDETFGNISAHTNERVITAGSKTFLDTLGARCEALCGEHALAQLRGVPSPYSQNPIRNSNGKRSRPRESFTNGPPSETPQPAGQAEAPREKPTLDMWLSTCDGASGSLLDLHLKWKLFSKRASARFSKLENLEGYWKELSLTFALGHMVNITKHITSECRLLIDESSRASYISCVPIIRDLHEFWPVEKNSGLEDCITKILLDRFGSQEAEQLVAYALDLNKLAEDNTIFVHQSSQQELPASLRHRKRQLQLEQRENDVTQREDDLKQNNLDYETKVEALNNDRALNELASTRVEEARKGLDERERMLRAHEASFGERLAAEEIMFTARETEIERTERTLDERLKTYNENQKLLLKNERRVDRADESHARLKVEMDKRRTEYDRLKKKLDIREDHVNNDAKSNAAYNISIKKRENIVISRENRCATEEAKLKSRGDALRNDEVKVANYKEEAIAEKKALENDRLVLSAKRALFENEKTVWRKNIGKNLQQFKEAQENMQENMQKMQVMEKTLSIL